MPPHLTFPSSVKLHLRVESKLIQNVASQVKTRYVSAVCRGGEIGRRARFKIWLGQLSVGSSPTLGTISF